ncbi:MAG: hypothetical protein MUC55_04515 [Burkholderiales bacterium]|jgi:hypothetical protein|nr:hypothetical protein [Burkholderiales bacterium]
MSTIVLAAFDDVATSDTIRHPSRRFSILDDLVDAARTVAARMGGRSGPRFR